jgi:hypothetical protein
VRYPCGVADGLRKWPLLMALLVRASACTALGNCSVTKWPLLMASFFFFLSFFLSLIHLLTRVLKKKFCLESTSIEVVFNLGFLPKDVSFSGLLLTVGKLSFYCQIHFGRKNHNTVA